MTKRPSREQFAAAYLDRSITVNELCLLFRVSDTTIKHWARRFGLTPRPTGGWRGLVKAPPIVLKHEENHCEPLNDGPMFGDPTPEEIAELTAYCRARRIMEGHVSYVYIEQPAEDLAWVA